MSDHARFSPSAAHRWMRCPGSLALEEQMPKKSTSYADEGTVAHEVGSLALKNNTPASAYIGRVFTINGKQWTVSEDMADYVQSGYVDLVREAVEGYKLAGAVDVQLLVEVRVHYEEFIEQPDAFGTSDVIILVTWADGTSLIDVRDLKYGYNIVEAEHNEQMMTYALGVLQDFGLSGNFTRAIMTIHQPRQNHVSQWECSVAALKAFAIKLRQAARDATAMAKKEKSLRLEPGDKQCQWCAAKATCPALRNFVEEAIGAGFDDLTSADANPKVPVADEGSTLGDLLASAMAKIDLVEDWCKSIRSAVEAELFAGRSVPGYKLVQGKRGNRAWSDKALVESTLKGWRMRQEEMYDFSLISPTTAEKRLKKENPRRWAKLQELINQPEGKPHVAPVTDPREALSMKPIEDGFDNISEGELA